MCEGFRFDSAQAPGTVGTQAARVRFPAAISGVAVFPFSHAGLLSNTKAAEYFPQQIFAGEFAGNFPERALRQTQIFGE